MDKLNEFLEFHTTPEHSEMIRFVYDRLEEIGYVEHQINLERILYVDDIETYHTLSLVFDILKEACSNLFLKMFIIVDNEKEFSTYYKLLKALDELENTSDSQVIVSIYNEELSRTEQLTEWLRHVRPEWLQELDEFVIDVMPTLLENILTKHELNVPTEAAEVDEEFMLRVALYKELAHKILSVLDTEPAVAIAKGRIKHLLDFDVMVQQIGPYIRRDDISANAKAESLVIAAIFTKEPPHAFQVTASRLKDELMTDIKESKQVEVELSRIVMGVLKYVKY